MGLGVAWPREPGRVAALTNCTVSDFGLDGAEQEFLYLINEYRADQNPPAPPLSIDPELNRAAQWLADDMAAHQAIYHNEPYPPYRGPYQRMLDCGQTGIRYFGEIVLRGSTSASGALAMWRTSSGHDCAIRYPGYTTVGIGRSGGYWAVDFNGTQVLWDCPYPVPYTAPGGTPPTVVVPATNTPGPTNTPSPTNSPSPTNTPQPTATPTTVAYQSFAPGASRE